MTDKVITKKEKQREIYRCGVEPLYFINNFCKIVRQDDQGRVLFKTYPFQDECVHSFINNKLTLILKARQLGCSTIVAAYIAWLILFHRSKEVLIVATQQETAKNLLKKVKNIIRWLPTWLAQEVGQYEKNNETHYVLKNGSSVRASATSGGAIRSEALALLVIDEAAHIDNMEELWLAMKPTIATGGRCIALSTPLGFGNWFAETCIKAEKGENDWNLLKFDWRSHPDRDDAWYKQERKNYNQRGWDQEYEISFVASGQTIIDPKDILKIKNTQVVKPIKQDFVDGNLWVWKLSDPEAEYCFTIDVARGDGGDNSVLDIWDLGNLEQVVQYASNEIGTDIFSKLIYKLSLEYGKNPLIVVDASTYGNDLCKKLIELGITNLYFSNKGGHGEYVPQFRAETMRHNVVPGLTISSQNRPQIFTAFEEYVRNDKVIIRSSRTLGEIETFVWNHHRPEAASGHKDDTITTAAMVCYIKENYFKDVQKKTEKQKMLLRSIYVVTGSVHDIIGKKINTYNTKESELARWYKRNSWIIRG